MARMKTFFIYFILFIGLYIVSSLLEYGLILNMYQTISGTIENNNQLSIEIEKAKATNVNGYMNFKITNKSNENIDTAYIKIDFIDKFNLNAITQYVVINDLSSKSTKNYKLNFRGSEISEYKLSFVSEIPDKSHIINILGWEIDATNVFGLGIDLTNVNGIDITQYLSFGKIKDLATDSVELGVSLAESVPIWSYAMASLIILWFI